MEIKARQKVGGQHWWANYPLRMIQTNFREIDMADVDAESFVQSLLDFGANAVTLNAGGIIASYPTKLDCQTQSSFLKGSSLAELVDACHRAGIRVIARMDFSKVRYPLYEQHPEWAYRDKDGQIVNYNGDVQTCPSGAYQDQLVLDILREVLSLIPFDGVFFNMSGFLVVDYSGVYHGPCHCENCQRKFKAMAGPDARIPMRDDPRDPTYLRYAAFKGAVIRAHREKMIQTVREVSPEIAIHGVDYIRTESGTEIGQPYWPLNASRNARLTAGPYCDRMADNASVDFLGFQYREVSTSPARMAHRQWQNLANAGSTSLYIMGRLDNHRDTSCFAPTRRVFAFHKAHEDIYTGMQSAAEVVLVHRTLMARIDPEVSGWSEALTHLHIPYCEVKQAELTEDTLAGRRVLILPDVGGMKPELAALADRFAAAGGTVIASGHTGMKQNPASLACLGVARVTADEKDHMSALFEITEQDADRFPACRETPYIAIGSALLKIESEENTERCLRLVPEHPFGPPERCYFDERSRTADAGVTVHTHGAGRGIYIPWLPGTFLFQEGHSNTLHFLADVLHELARCPVTAPQLSPMVELNVHRTAAGKLLVQLINGSGCWGNEYFDPLPVSDIALQLPARLLPKGTAEGAVKAEALNGGAARAVREGDTVCVQLNRLVEYEGIVLG